MANNSFGDVFNPQFERLIQYTFDKPVATTIANKKTGKTKERFNLDLVEVTIYGKMAGFHLNGQEIFISEQTLAKICGVSDRKIRDSIKSLENTGLISVVKSKGKSNHYKLLITPSQICKMCDAQGIQPMSNAGGEDKQPQEAPKQATQQPEKPEAMQSPSQPKKERRERRRDAGKREKDFYGYPVLTNSEAKAAYLAAKAKYKSKGRVKLSVLRDEIYGYEVMKNIKGTIDGKIMNSAKYWHLTDQAFRLANLLKENEEIEIIVDTEANPGDLSKPFPAWQNCRLRNGKMVLLDK
ncbi:helix-turn-helix domain-containing protein [Escherichia coli]|nr:helix-turn-helix domain-containing protein [Escherichia coli]